MHLIKSTDPRFKFCVLITDQQQRTAEVILQFAQTHRATVLDESTGQVMVRISFGNTYEQKTLTLQELEQEVRGN